MLNTACASLGSMLENVNWFLCVMKVGSINEWCAPIQLVSVKIIGLGPAALNVAKIRVFAIVPSWTPQLAETCHRDNLIPCKDAHITAARTVFAYPAHHKHIPYFAGLYSGCQACLWTERLLCMLVTSHKVTKVNTANAGYKIILCELVTHINKHRC